MSKKLNSVTASNFLNWYFSDASEIREFGNSMIEQMKTFGIANIDVKQLFDGCGYIPQFICENSEEQDEYSPEEIEFINDINSH